MHRVATASDLSRIHTDSAVPCVVLHVVSKRMLIYAKYMQENS